jgi:hypothetical protein
MKNNGLNINEFQIKLLQKIEELTLYIIDLKKENLQAQSSIEKLKALTSKLEKEVRLKK